MTRLISTKKSFKSPPLLWESRDEVSCNSHTLWHRVCVGKTEKSSETDTKLRSVSGNYLPVLGVFRTNLKINQESFPTEFYVIKDIKRDLVIGRDFMFRYGVILDMG